MPSPTHNTRRSFLHLFWPIGILLSIEIVLFLTNYTPGTWLLGWDNVVPELNFPVAFARSIFGVWQEYRGLGLLDGMSHIANLPHTLFLFSLSSVVPAPLLRYVFTFLMHLVGGIGVYALISLLFHAKPRKQRILISLIASLFYLLNLATVQMFYTPLETFSVHFAALPWLAWSLIRYYQMPNKKRFVLFLFIAVLSTPQYFTPTFLVPVVILLTGVSLPFLLQRPHAIVRSCVVAAVGFVLVNAFWLLPYAYGVPQNAPVVTSAKINQMGSMEAFARNKAFGDIKNVLLLRGFSLDYEDIDANNTPIFMMAPWRSYIDAPLVQLASGVIVCMMLLGILAILRKPKQISIGFIGTFIVCVIFLGNDIPYLRSATLWFQNTIPFFREIFRFPFTKFSLLYTLSYTVLFAYGFAALIAFERNKRIIYITSAAIIIGIGIVALPAFGGNFIYQNLRIALPEDYLSFFTYAKQLDPTGRMAVLPQPSYWSWKYYRYGYRGSGFLWEGMSQPTMDRAFDPWSTTNENYYWELSKALYSKDAVAFTDVLTKYNIRYILLDNYLVSDSNNRSLFTSETKELFTTIPAIQRVRTFGSLELYELKTNHMDSNVFIATDLPTVSPVYHWTDNDVAFRDLGNYVTKNASSGTTYPFRSLFTKRATSQQAFQIQENDSAITITSPNTATGSSILKKTNIVYDTSTAQSLDEIQVKPCGLLKSGNVTTESIQDFQGSYLHFMSLNQRSCFNLDIPQLSHKYGYIAAVESRFVAGRPLLFSFINDTARHVELETDLPQTTDWETTYFVLPPLASDGLGYSVYLGNDAIGRDPSINDLRRIRIYQFPYQELVNIHHAPNNQSSPTINADFSISHPNSSYYKITLSSNPSQNTTLILSQSFDPGWKAYAINTQQINQLTNSPVQKWLFETFPFLFGTEIKDHVLVNNWENGWVLAKPTVQSSEFMVQGNKNQLPTPNSEPVTIVLFFWPQLLEWIGFFLLPIPFVWALRKNKGV